jgi:hypothetical protein
MPSMTAGILTRSDLIFAQLAIRIMPGGKQKPGTVSRPGTIGTMREFQFPQSTDL